MTGYVQNIEEITLKNEAFRHVVFTGQHLQLVVMLLKPREDIGEEVHQVVDQFFRVESGSGKVIMNGEEHHFKDGFAFIVPAGTLHNVVNTSADKPLKLYTIYTPPQHKDGTVHATKEEAASDTQDHL